MNMLSYRQADSNVKCYQSVSEAMAMCPIFAFLILGSYPLTCPGCVELYLCKEFMNCKMDEQKNTRLSPLSTTSLCMCLSVFHVFGDYYVLFPVIASWSSFRLSLLPLFSPMRRFIHLSIHTDWSIHVSHDVSMYVCILVYPSISIDPSMHPFVHPSIEYFCVRPPMHVSTYLSIHACIHPSIYPSMSIHEAS